MEINGAAGGGTMFGAAGGEFGRLQFSRHRGVHGLFTVQGDAHGEYIAQHCAVARG